jgi:hypothetical protein
MYLVCRTIELSDCQTVGLLDRRTIEVSDYRSDPMELSVVPMLQSYHARFLCGLLVHILKRGGERFLCGLLKHILKLFWSN